MNPEQDKYTPKYITVKPGKEKKKTKSEKHSEKKGRLLSKEWQRE